MSSLIGHAEGMEPARKGNVSKQCRRLVILHLVSFIFEHSVYLKTFGKEKGWGHREWPAFLSRSPSATVHEESLTLSVF